MKELWRAYLLKRFPDLDRMEIEDSTVRLGRPFKTMTYGWLWKGGKEWVGSISDAIIPRLEDIEAMIDRSRPRP